MEQIGFKPGYYEWLVYLNGEFFYSFSDDISDDIPIDASYSDLESIVEDYITLMQFHLWEDGKDELDPKYIPELKRQILDEWAYHFGIEPGTMENPKFTISNNIN